MLALGETIDHVGPLTRSVEDTSPVLAAISGEDQADPTSLSTPLPDFSEIGAGVAGLQIGYDAAFAKQGTDSALLASMETALA